MSSIGGVIQGISVAHGRATVDDLEATGVDSQRDTVDALVSTPGVEEAFVLRTCNRVESYVVTDDAAVGRAALARISGDAAESAVVELGHEESLRHLLRVAAGLESVVLGEDQILGQIRDAFEDARGAGAIGPILEDAVTKAMRVGERARTETAINEGVVSLASAAVRLADRETNLEGGTGLVVGAGEMGTLAAKAMAETVDRLLVANRTVPHADHVAEAVDVEAVALGLDRLSWATAKAEVVVTATAAPKPVFDRPTLAGAGETVVVDIGQPRDVPPAVAGDVEDVTVRDLDDLESVTEATRERRSVAAGAVEEIVDEEFDRLLAQFKRKRADRVIAAMYESAEGVKANELGTALSKLDLDPEEEAIVESMADSLVSQLLAAPTKSLRDAAEADDWETIHTALRLFDPEFGPEAEGTTPFVADVGPEEVPAELRDRLPASVRGESGED